MANTFITPSIVAREALLILENNLVAAQLVHRDYASEFTAAKRGDTISIRTPATLTVNEFTTTTSVQDATETSVSLQLEKHYDVSVAITAKDLTLNLENFSAQIVEPAMVAIADKIDTYVLGKYIQAYNYISQVANEYTGTHEPPDTIAEIALVEKKANDLKFPLRGRNAIINSEAKADILSLATIHESDKRGDAGTTLRDASLGTIFGIDWYLDQNVPAHTKGTLAGAGGGALATKANTAAAATSITLDTGGAGTLAGTLVAGDIVTVDDHTGSYVVTANATAASNEITFSIDPPLREAIDDGDIWSLVNTHDANLVFHPNALALATVPLALPQSNERAAYLNSRGLGVRVVFDYDTSTKKDLVSFDVLCGAKVIDPRLIFRMLG